MTDPFEANKTDVSVLVSAPTKSRESRSVQPQLPDAAAAGVFDIAQAIISRARETGVPVHESPELVAALMQFDLDRCIPAGLYTAVAEVLAWIYQMEQA